MRPCRTEFRVAELMKDTDVPLKVMVERNMDNNSNPAIILIADSSEAFFNSLQDALKTTDYAFVYASNGEEALRLHDLLKSEIELAIIELELPASGGFEVIERFTQRGPKPRKIIATSSIFPQSFLEHVRCLGVDAVVRKPITLQAWLQLFKQMCLCSPPGELSRIAYGVCPDRSVPSQVLPREPALLIPQPGGTSGSLPRPALSYFVPVLAVTWIVLALFLFRGLLEKRTIAAAAKPVSTQMLCPVIVPIGASPAMKVVEAAPTPPHRAILHPSQRRKKQPVPQPAASVALFRGFRPLRQTSLDYPAEARNEHVSGEVEMQITIAQNGSVQNPRVLSGDPLLCAGLVAGVSKWLYQPLRINGEPVEMVTELGIVFNLPSTSSRFLLLGQKFSKKERSSVVGIQTPVAFNSRSVLSGL
jgi:CheY-like chemotaxis protein